MPIVTNLRKERKFSARAPWRDELRASRGRSRWGGRPRAQNVDLGAVVRRARRSAACGAQRRSRARSRATSTFCAVCVHNVESALARRRSRRSAPPRHSVLPLNARSSSRRGRDRPPRAPPWKPVPLTLITGPANAAKVGAVLERLRAARPRDPLLVVPTAADVSHYQRELASSNIVFGAEVLTFSRLVREIARRTKLRARPLGWTARDRVVRAAVAGVPLRELAGSGRRRPASPTPPGGCSPSSSAPGSSRRASPRRCAPGPAAARARPTRASSARSTPPTAARSRSSGARRSRATRGRRSTPCAPTRPCGAGARCSSTASTTSRRPSATPSRR